MKPSFLITMFAVAGGCLFAQNSSQLTKEELKIYAETQKKLYPKKGDLYQQVIDLFGPKDHYSAEEILAASEPTAKGAFPYHQRRTENRVGSPLGSIPRQLAEEHLTGYEMLHPASSNLFSILITNYGDHPWYRADELRDVIDNSKPSARKYDIDRPADDPVFQALIRGETREKSLLEGFKGVRVRQSWRDVLYDEEPSQPENQAKVLKDLVGATFSYVHNWEADSDTWAANGALLFPWQHDLPLTGGLLPGRIAAAPSVSINRIDTSGDPEKEANSLFFRAGFYGDWYFSTPTPSGFQARAAAVYATDTDFDGDLLGYELDLEPRWQNEVFPIGYKKTLIERIPVKENQTDTSALEYQLRFWAHVEGGEIQNAGKAWEPTEDSFFRIGPSAQLQFNAPGLVFGNDFSVTGLYSYLEAFSGTEDHESYYKINASLNLFKNEELNRKVNLSADYQNGGLALTKDDVDVFTIGLGILF